VVNTNFKGFKIREHELLAQARTSKIIKDYDVNYNSHSSRFRGSKYFTTNDYSWVPSDYLRSPSLTPRVYRIAPR